ncbi:uncharacterized protein LOC119635436 [Glossina fuscipes]|uniref:Galectin n=1 Tax=Glossina fuscipes TaxID=7396 RepID=A0A8U0WLH0_9MUSC|nr:uncharacterized protein LOC119635436 [Glossina fuscipes]
MCFGGPENEEQKDIKTESTKAEVVTTELVKAEADKANGDSAETDKAEDDNAEEANVDPDLKYASHDLGEMKEGVSFRIRGKILDEANCALRILALVEENLIARYYKDNNNWGPEEDYSQSPYKLVPGKIVAMEVLITEPGFYIAVNCFHVCIFKHHFPYTHIKAIEIRGDIDLAFVERKLVYEYPQRSARSSHFGRIVGSGSHRWPAPAACYDVAFKFYNSKQGEKAPALGDNEEAIDMKSKEDLKLVIVRGKKGYETKANKKSLKTRPYKINPNYVNTALIYGDLKLIDIQIITD